jgi:hypothetical protein
VYIGFVFWGMGRAAAPPIPQFPDTAINIPCSWPAWNDQEMA